MHANECLVIYSWLYIITLMLKHAYMTEKIHYTPSRKASLKCCIEVPRRQRLVRYNWQLAVCFVNSFVAVILSDAWGGGSDTPAKAATFVGGTSAELRSASKH